MPYPSTLKKRPRTIACCSTDSAVLEHRGSKVLPLPSLGGAFCSERTCRPNGFLWNWDVHSVSHVVFRGGNDDLLLWYFVALAPLGMQYYGVKVRENLAVPYNRLQQEVIGTPWGTNRAIRAVLTNAHWLLLY